jgi:hypothetical protein
MSRISLVARLCVLAAATTTLTGCAFEREWQSAQSYSWPENELAGCWEGNWHSDWNGHEGGLRAIVTKQGEGYYHAHFKATFLKVVPYEFELPMLVTEDGHIYTFEGDADLGLLAGGKYVYNGTASGGQFQADYSAENNDHGTFTMSKVHSCGECGSAECAGCRPVDNGTREIATTFENTAVDHAEFESTPVQENGE